MSTKNVEYLCDMMKTLQFIFGIILLVIISACSIEKAQVSKRQKLVIASDCLNAGDTLLFKRFVASTGIRLRIIHFSADSLKQVLKNEGIQTKLDVVILSSVYDMHHFEKSDLLQVMQLDELPSNLPKKYLSETKKWAGIGIDPYVLLTLKDSTGKIRTYKDLLTKTKWCSTLTSNSDWFQFYATIIQKMDPMKDYNAYDYIKQLQATNFGELTKNDSSLLCNTLLTNYSSYRTSEIIQKSRFKNGKLIFPNQRTGGSFYNMPCFGIVRQARNYQNALEFFEYLLIENVNKHLNNYWKTFPIISNKESPYSYQNIRYKKFSTTPIYLNTYYDRVKNILESIK